MDLLQRMYFFHWLLHFFENLIWVQEPLINSWFNIPIAQIYTFILFLSASVLFEGVFSLRVSLRYLSKSFKSQGTYGINNVNSE